MPRYSSNWTTRRPPDDRKETQTNCSGMVMFPVDQVWPKPFCKAQSKGEEDKANRNKKEVGRQHQGMDRPGVRQVLEGSGEEKLMEESGCEVICSEQTTPADKG